MALKTSNKNRKKEIKQEKVSKIIKTKLPKIEFKLNHWVYVGIVTIVLITAVIL